MAIDLFRRMNPFDNVRREIDQYMELIEEFVPNTTPSSESYGFAAEYVKTEPIYLKAEIERFSSSLNEIKKAEEMAKAAGYKIVRKYNY